MPKHYQGLVNGRSLMQPQATGRNVSTEHYESIFGKKELNVMSDEDRERCSIESDVSQWDLIKHKELGEHARIQEIPE